MARTRFPTLQQRISLVSVRGPSGVGTQEAVRTMNVLSSNLDKMSNYFFKKAGAIAEIEGAEFGAKNAITEKQLRDQSLSGEELETKLGDKNTIFGRASRKASIAVLETELELSAKKLISETVQNAIATNQDADDLATGLDAITLQYSKLAGQASPILGKRLTATLNTTSSARYHDYAVKQANESLKVLKAKKLANINLKVDALSPTLTKMIDEAPDDKTISKILDTKNKNSAVNLQKFGFVNELSTFATSATTYDNFIKDYDSEVSNFKSKYILGKTLQSGRHSVVARAIRSNDYKNVDYRIKGIIKSMDTEQVTQLYKDLNAQSKEIANAEKQDDENSEIRSRQKINDLNIEILSALGKKNRNLDLAKTKLDELKLLDIDGNLHTSLSEKFLKAEDEGDLNVYNSLKDKSDRGILTAEELSINAKDLNADQIDDLRDELKTIQNNKMKLALNDLTGYFNTEFPGFDPAIIDNLAKRNQFLKPLSQYKKIKAELGRALEDAQAEGKDINLEDLTEKKFDDFKNNILDKVKEQNISRANNVYDKIKTTAGSAFPKLNEFQNTDHARVLEFIAENKGKLFGDGKPFTQREYKTFFDNLKKAMTQ
jgi:hypothetical protein